MVKSLSEDRIHASGQNANNNDENIETILNAWWVAVSMMKWDTFSVFWDMYCVPVLVDVFADDEQHREFWKRFT